MTGKSFSYTPEQLRRMEEDAIRSAREMGVRGGHFGRPSSAQGAPSPQQPPPRPPERKPGIGPVPPPQPNPPRPQQPRPQRTYPPPRQQPSYQQQSPPFQQAEAGGNPLENLLKSFTGGSGISGGIDELLKSFGLDADKLLILFLMFILIREEGDFMLILALGYILL